jgi:ABC-type antimicrobial peptide transport system permease subunit
VGVYGLLAYSVARRTREIGVRVALGADGGRITRMILRDGLILVGLGLAIGVPAAMASARWLRGLTFGISTTDPAVLAATIVALILIGMSAGVLPSRRASRIDPMVALRQD